MMDQSRANLSISGKETMKEVFSISQKEREVLRRLAARVAELSLRPIEKEKRDLWYRHNALEKTRPLVFCDPENGWNEIITSKQMECSNKLAREWEMYLRKEIFWGESMLDDKVIEPYFNVPYVYQEGDWGMQETRIGGQNGGSYRWEAPLRSYDDIERLHYPVITVDYEATKNLLALASRTFGDLLTVRLKGGWWWSLGMTTTLVYLRGLEQVMLDMYDQPEGLHRLLSFLRDGMLAKLKFLEENGLLSLNNDGTYVGSGGFGFTDQLPARDFSGKVRLKDMWGFGESQETTAISPEMFAEFIFPYQVSVLERFGLNCYGCCEPLDKRWSVVKKIPRLRRVSVSPWADRAVMAENLGADYIYSLKPHPGDLACPVIDEDRIRFNLRRDLEITRGCRVEIIMKDNHTIGHNPENVIRWCRIAREESERIFCRQQ